MAEFEEQEVGARRLRALDLARRHGLAADLEVEEEIRVRKQEAHSVEAATRDVGRIDEAAAAAGEIERRGRRQRVRHECPNERVPEPRVPAEPAETVEKKADGIARRSNVSNPRLIVYDIPRSDPAELRSAVLVVPGGGFGILADEHEGSAACRFLNEHGIVAFLVLHRVPTGQMPVPNAGPVQDVQKAVQEVRRRAAEFHLDPAKIAVLGFSAGGQAALVAATNPPPSLWPVDQRQGLGG